MPHESASRSPMRCLWIARYIPYPADAGAKVYSASMAQSLARAGASVRFMGFGNTDAIPPHAAADVEWVSIPNGKRSEVAGLFSRLPVAAAIDSTRSYAAAIERELREPWDAIVLDGYGTGWALGRCLRHRRHLCERRPVLVHVSHNHEEQLWRTMAREASVSFAKRVALWQNYLKVRALERKLARSVDLLSAITEEDRRSLGAALPEDRVLTLTPGYSGPTACERTIDRHVPRRVILVGSFRWIMKQENLARFVELADPVFSANGIELDVVGDVPDELAATLRERSRATRFHGFVADIAPLLMQARLAVVPEAIGGGFKLKFLDYVFARVPIATLSRAVTGLPEELRRATLAREQLPALVDAIVAHIDRVEELNGMQERALEAGRSAFCWDERGRRLRQAIAHLRHERPTLQLPADSGEKLPAATST